MNNFDKILKNYNFQILGYECLQYYIWVSLVPENGHLYTISITFTFWNVLVMSLFCSTYRYVKFFFQNLGYESLQYYIECHPRESCTILALHYVLSIYPDWW